MSIATAGTARAVVGSAAPTADGRLADWWLAAALALAMLFGARTMTPLLVQPDWVQDDVRQHVFWMARFRDPSLFPADPIADYYAAISPPAYRALFRALSPALDPRTTARLLPLVLAFVTAVATFSLGQRLHGSPAVGFLASVLLSWYSWQYADLASGTPRAFVLPSLSLICWALLAGRPLLAAGLVGLAAAFYPVGGALGLGLLGLRLVRRRGWRPHFVTDRAAWLAFALAGALAGMALLPTLLATGRYGPLVSGPEAAQFPEFGPAGRQPYFIDDSFAFWLVSEASGLDLMVRDQVWPKIRIFVELLALAATLPLALLLRRRLPAVGAVRPAAWLLFQLTLASFALFFLAHVVRFQLYLPSRYVKWSLPLALALSAGLGLVALLQALADRLKSRRPQLLVAVGAGAVALLVAVYPARYSGLFWRDPNPGLTAYLTSQPPATLVAAPPRIADMVGIFARRPVLVSREHALPFHSGYLGLVRTRLDDLIEAYYAERPEAVAQFIRTYQVDLLVVDSLAFDPRTFQRSWTGYADGLWEPYTSRIAQRFQAERHFVLPDLARRCNAHQDNELVVVSRSGCPELQ